MKIGPVTKLDKRNKTTLKKFNNDVILGNCDIIANFPIYGQFGAISMSGSGRKTYVLIDSNLLSYKI